MNILPQIFNFKTNNLIRELIVKFIEIIDKTYMNSKQRKIKYEINKQNVEKCIVTIFGEINFKRTFYKEKKSKNYYFFIDDILGLEKYNTYDPIVRGLTIRDTVNNNPNNASYHLSPDSLDILNILIEMVLLIYQNVLLYLLELKGKGKDVNS